MYTNVNISHNQKQRLRKALASGSDLSLQLSHDDLVGEDLIALTQSQCNKLKKAHETGKGVTISMSNAQIAHNMKVRGGILPLLAGLSLIHI